MKDKAEQGRLEMEEFKPSKKIIRSHTHDYLFGIYGVQASDDLASDIQASKKIWMNEHMNIECEICDVYEWKNEYTVDFKKNAWLFANK